MPDHDAGAGRRRDRVLRIAARVPRGRDPRRHARAVQDRPGDRLRGAADDLGENRVQEAEAKVGEVAARGTSSVRSRRTRPRRALEIFGTIQSVDSVELAARLDRIAAEVRPDERVPVLLEVNVDGDPAKSGFPPADSSARSARSSTWRGSTSGA